MNERKTIYLDDAIDAVSEGLKHTFVEHRDVAEKMLNNVPSAQPKIIRCENCMFYKTDDDIFPDRQDWCEMWESGTVAYGYCYHAERIQDDRT